VDGARYGYPVTVRIHKCDLGHYWDHGDPVAVRQHRTDHPGEFTHQTLATMKEGDYVKPPVVSAATRMVKYAEESGATFFSDRLGARYAHVPIGTHREVLDLAGSAAGHWLADLMMEHESGKVPDSAGIREALGVLASRARKGDILPVYLRIGALDGPGMAIDLGTPEWTAIVIRPGRWAVEPHPVMFQRGGKSAALPTPVTGGSFAPLRDLLNLPDTPDGRRHLCLLVGFLLGAMRPEGPYMGLQLAGPAGSAKTSAARLIRRLIDPTAHMAEVSAMPKKQDSFGTTVRGSFLPAFDNVTAMSNEQSDWLAQLATGYATSDRTLYTNADEFNISVSRPFIINGIDTADRGDLLSRVTTITLPAIDAYSTIEDMDRRFDEAWPAILGTLCDVVAQGLVVLPTLPVTGWTVRSADHVRWVTACEPALGWPDRSYEALVKEENDRSQAVALDALPWYSHLTDLLSARGGSWCGGMGDLLAELRGRAENTTKDGRVDNFGWPRSPKGMAESVRRAEAGLRAVGIRVAERAGSRRDGRLYEWATIPEDPEGGS
jgi:hypothetical protein